MTREEALKLWLPIMDMGTENMPECKEALQMAIKALEQEPRWIPCSERLPDDNVTVTVSVQGDVFPEARYSKDDGWEWLAEACADYWEELDGVDAWMPLPKPYEPQESEVEE